MENRASFGLECVGVELLELLVRRLERKLVDVIRDRELFNERFEPRDFRLGGRDDVVEGVYFRRLRLSRDEVDVDVLGDLYVPGRNGLKEG